MCSESICASNLLVTDVIYHTCKKKKSWDYSHAYTIPLGKRCSGEQMEVFLLLHTNKRAFRNNSDLSESGQHESVLPELDVIPGWDDASRQAPTGIMQQDTTAHEVWHGKSAHCIHHLFMLEGNSEVAKASRNKWRKSCVKRRDDPKGLSEITHSSFVSGTCLGLRS